MTPQDKIVAPFPVLGSSFSYLGWAEMPYLCFAVGSIAMMTHSFSTAQEHVTAKNHRIGNAQIPTTLTTQPNPSSGMLPSPKFHHRPIHPPRRHSTNTIFSANWPPKKCRSGPVSFHVGICRSRGRKIPRSVPLSDCPSRMANKQAVLRLNSPGSGVSYHGCFIALVFLFITRWCRCFIIVPGMHACKIRLELLTYRRFSAFAARLARSPHFLLSNNYRA